MVAVWVSTAPGSVNVASWALNGSSTYAVNPVVAVTTGNSLNTTRGARSMSQPWMLHTVSVTRVSRSSSGLNVAVGVWRLVSPGTGLHEYDVMAVPSSVNEKPASSCVEG